MYLEPIVVRFVADATQYNRVFSNTLASLNSFSANAVRAAGGIGSAFAAITKGMTQSAGILKAAYGQDVTAGLRASLNKLKETSRSIASGPLSAWLMRGAGGGGGLGLGMGTRPGEYWRTGGSGGGRLPIGPPPTTPGKSSRDYVNSWVDEFSKKSQIDLRKAYSKIKLINNAEMEKIFPSGGLGQVRGLFMPSTRTIYLNREALKTRRMAKEVLAHELGHAQDLMAGGGVGYHSSGSTGSNMIGKMDAKALARQYARAGQQLTPNQRQYLMNPVEGYARTFSDLMMGKKTKATEVLKKTLGLSFGSASTGMPGPSAFMGLGGSGGGLLARTSGVSGALAGVAGNTAAGVVGGLGQAGLGVVGMGLSLIKTAAIPAAIALTAVAGATAVASYKAIKLAGDYEQAAISLEVMTGSAAKGKAMLDDLTKMAAETPFTSPELIGGAKQLKSFGFANDQIIPTLTAMGNVSAGTGTSLERIILAFGQVRAMGRLMGPELRQMTDAGIPILENLAAVMGKPVQAIKGLVEAGQVSSGVIVQAFNRMTQAGGIFANLMARQAETVQGRWSTLSDNVGIALRNVGLSFFKGFGLADMLRDYNQMTEGLGRNTDQFEDFFRVARRVFDALVDGFGAVLQIVGGDLFDKLSPGKSWDDWGSTAENAIGWVVTAVGVLADTIKSLYQQFAQEKLGPWGEMFKLMGKATGQDEYTQIGNMMAKEAGNSAQQKVIKARRPGWGGVTDWALEKLGGVAGVFGGLAGMGLERNMPGGDEYENIDPVTGKPTESYATRLTREFNRRRATTRGVLPNDAAMAAAGGVALSALGSAIRTGAMRVPLEISGEAVRFAAKTTGDYIHQGGGRGAFGIYEHQQKMLNEGRFGTKNMQLGMLGAAFGSMPLMMGAMMNTPHLTEEMFKFGTVKSYRQLQEAVGTKADSYRTAPTAMFGSVAAQDAISVAQTKGLSIQEQVLETLREAKRELEETKKIDQEIAEALKNIEKNPGLLGKKL